MFFKKKNDNLFDFLVEPQDPWGDRVVLPAAGIIASGWTSKNNVFLLSSDGYSVSDSKTGEIEIWNEDDNNINQFSSDNLEFTICEIGETIKVFGLRGGNGNHLTFDRWNLDSFHIGLGQQIIGLRNLKKPSKQGKYWQDFNLIHLERLEHFTLTYGFSPNQNKFGIFGSGGAEIFTRFEWNIYN